MASPRNLAIGILGGQGYRNIAAALRRNARDATRVLPCSASPGPSLCASQRPAERWSGWIDSAV
jgi:hypothetical protein